MSEKRAGGIVASSFVAGLLLAAGVFAPRAWEPIPEPFFGLDERGSSEPTAPVIVGGRREDTPAVPTPAGSGAGQAAFDRPAERLALNELGTHVAPAAAVQAAAIAAREALAAAPPETPEAAESLPPAPAPPPADGTALPPPVVATPVVVAGPEIPPLEPADARVNSSAAPQPPTPDPRSTPLAASPQPESLRALVERVQANRPQPADGEALPRRMVPPTVAARLDGEPQAAADGLGAAPLPGEEWIDPDRANWSDVPLNHPVAKPNAPVHRPVLRPRLRVAERILGRDRAADQATTPAADDRPRLPDVRSWPMPRKLVTQCEDLAGSTPASESSAWADDALGRLRAVLATNGPADAEADPALVTLGEAVHAGMGIADAATDHSQASATRRTALALARRVAVWRAATGLCARGGPGDARIEAELARVLDAIERFELSTAPDDAAIASRSTALLGATAHPGAVSLAKAVRDHYMAANVRVAVHQRFLEKLLPDATVTTGPVDDLVMGRKVRGTRTVQRTTTVMFVPDSDEISFDLEVHGDVESRTVTDSGPVSLTSRGEASFTVRKPIKVSSVGLLFGTATAVASNRSQLANVQTSFDSVPLMRSLVRNIARNQHEETLPEANREVIDHIISRACREVDAQAEPKFAEAAARIRDRIWMPLMRLGLEPTPVAMETTTNMATLRLRLAADEQLAAHTPRPRAPTDSLLSLQVHESTLNNTLERLGLAGRRFPLEELVAMLYDRAGVDSPIPDDLPEGVQVTFSRTQPLRIECREGLVHMRVALDAIESGRRSWYDIVAQVAYKPATAAPQVFLEREGPVQLSGPGHQGRIEFALRTIFSKIFPKERPIPVLPERIVKNPRLEGLHVLQAVSTDGWLALALGLREGETTVAKPAAADSKAADQRPRLFR